MRPGADRHARLTEIFLAASELEADRQAEFVRDACDGDPQLYADVQSLLAHEPEAVARLGTGAFASWKDPVDSPLPLRIGPYRILDRLGEGGMGVVLLAEQEEPIRRRVAIKLTRPSIETGRVLARFSTERQALALMNHPGIAHVFDAGVTAEGLPYFAMEYVAGQPITEYCNHARLDLRERLALFVEVCSAVQHAHQKAVIHRDLKPSNVLVTTLEGRALPKIIDFGIAKEIDRAPGDDTRTVAGEFLGTPDYMSPEQLESGGRDADTRSDVYALGVMLYELLVGVRPFGKRERQAQTTGEIARPSSRIRSLGEAAAAEAARRRSEPRALVRALRGDLDWITMKALAVERERRYASVAELAADITRYLRREPVAAGPPSAAYRLRKLVDRHRAASILVAVLGLVLLGSAVGLSVLARRVIVERNRASLEARLAREHAASAEQVAELLVGLFDVGGHEEADTVTARELLDRGAARIEPLGNQPVVQARMMMAVARSYSALNIEAGDPLARRAIEILRREVGDAHPETVAAKQFLGHWLLNTFSLEDAEPWLTEAVQAAPTAYGPDDPRTLEAISELGFLRKRQGRFAEAESVLRDGLGRSRRALGDEHPVTLRMVGRLAGALVDGGQHGRGEPLLAEWLPRMEEVLGLSHETTVVGQYNLACCAALAGDKPRAIHLLRTSLEAGMLYAWRFPDGTATFGREAVVYDPNLASLLGDPRFEALVGPDGSLASYEAAQASGEAGELDVALGHLRRAIERGFSNPRRPRDDHNLRLLRGRPEFEELVGTLEGSSTTPGTQLANR